MKKLKILFLLTFIGCIETDIEEQLEQNFMIAPTIRDVIFRVNESYFIDAIYTDEFGDTLDVDINWASSDPNVLSFDGDTARCHTTGVISITAEARGLLDETIIEIFDEDEDVNLATERNGMLQGVGGYDIVGDMTISTNSDGDVILNVEGYTPDGPGPYFYLSNSASSVSGGINLGEAKATGNYEINISALDANVSINSYDYLVVWCEPFRVRLGFGEFNN